MPPAHDNLETALLDAVMQGKAGALPCRCLSRLNLEAAWQAKTGKLHEACAHDKEVQLHFPVTRPHSMQTRHAK